MFRSLPFLLAFLVAACGPWRRGPEDRLPGDIEKRLEDEEKEREAELEGLDPAEDAQIAFQAVAEDTTRLRAATWNVNRYSAKKAARVRKPPLQPQDKSAKDLPALMTHWVDVNGVDLLAMQEILDYPPMQAPNDPDFPHLEGYVLLMGPKIKGWFGNRVEEHCPIYYRPGPIRSCTSDRGMNLAKTELHWAKCTTARNQEFWFGCAHIAYEFVREEVEALRDSITALRRKAPGTPGGGKFEYIVGMDANSYHLGRGRTNWDRFADSTGATLHPVASSGNPIASKISRKRGVVGPPSTREFHVLDWLVFQVQAALAYVGGSMRVAPLAPYTRDHQADQGDVSNSFQDKYHKSVSDHMPVMADFIVN